MFATMSVQVSPTTLLALMERLRETGRAISPNQFAGGYADSVRNAWQDISIRMPGEKNWKIADARRRELARAAPMSAAQPAPRDTTPGQGWTEPERRKYRFRLEDVAFD